jgi:hypothetical protein
MHTTRVCIVLLVEYIIIIIIIYWLVLHITKSVSILLVCIRACICIL